MALARYRSLIGFMLLPLVACLGCSGLTGTNDVLDSDAINKGQCGPEAKVYPSFREVEPTYVDKTVPLAFVLNDSNMRLRDALLDAIWKSLEAENLQHEDKESDASSSIFRVPVASAATGAFYAVLKPVVEKKGDRPEDCRRGICDLPAANGETAQGYAVFWNDPSLERFPLPVVRRHLVAEYRQLDDVFVRSLKNSGSQVKIDLAAAILVAVSAGLGESGTQVGSSEPSATRLAALPPELNPAYYLVSEQDPSTGTSRRPVGIVLKAPRRAVSDLSRHLEGNSRQEKSGQISQKSSVEPNQVCLDVKSGYFPQVILFPQVLPSQSQQLPSGLPDQD